MIDESLFMEIFVKHEADLRSYGRSLLPDWYSVDETLQEASIIMWRKIDQLQSIDEFLPWAKVILRFEALKTRRKFARDKHVFSDTLIEILSKEGLENQMPIANTQTALQKCLEKLSIPNRELVMAPYISDNSIVEIAKRSNRTENSLYKLIGRLRIKLRKCIQQELISAGGF
jgi:RNA polymerase sigma-70 factor (ECF subfamily)